MQWLARGRKNEERGCGGRANGLQSMARGLHLAGRLAPTGWPVQFFLSSLSPKRRRFREFNNFFWFRELRKKENVLILAVGLPTVLHAGPGVLAVGQWLLGPFFFVFIFYIYGYASIFLHPKNPSTMYIFFGQKIVCL